MNEDKELINNLTNRLFFGICLAIPRAEHPQVMNDKVKEVSLVREQTQDSFDGFEELYKRLFIN